MTRLATALLLGALTLSTTTAAATAGQTIARACMASERGAQAQALCGCIQVVADQVLTPAEQRRGAELFLAPHKAQEIRASGSRSDARFWEKWQAMAAQAGSVCQ